MRLLPFGHYSTHFLPTFLCFNAACYVLPFLSIESTSSGSCLAIRAKAVFRSRVDRDTRGVREDRVRGSSDERSTIGREDEEPADVMLALADVEESR